MHLEGKRLAHYDIDTRIGQGGMGEVWRASDSKLGRSVAVKVLPEEFVLDAERLARFDREARVLASLDHPHIATIHGIEEVDGIRFLVMQLADGEDLARRIEKRGAIPVDETIAIARQIAEALEAAHDKGIVHRDLKPANVMIGPDNEVKVLDFGLAKAFEAEEGDGDFSNSPTMARAATHAGVILGTAAYMSPEQARGRPVDKKADIWAFGAVVWEMLTGRRLFAGETVSDTLASVLKEEPDWSSLPPDTPAELRRILRRCLEKQPKNRLHDIADARIELDRLAAGSEDDRAPMGEARHGAQPRRLLAPWIILVATLVALAIAALAGWLVGRATSDPDSSLHLAIQLPPHQEFETSTNALLSFSPDGQSLVFSAREEGKRYLFRRNLGERESQRIEGSDDGEAPFFSPDGKWIGYNARGRLLRIPAEGGRPLSVVDARGSGGGTWLSNDTIVFCPIYSEGLFRVGLDGGEPVRLTTPDRANGELGHWWPRELPGGRYVLFTAFRIPVDRSRIGLLDLETGSTEWIVDGGFFARYMPTGHLLYARGPRLYAAPFDLETRRMTGPVVPVVDDLRVSQTGGYAMYDVSSNGTLAYMTHTVGNPRSELVWLDRTGRSEPASEHARQYLGATLSPDGRQAAVTIHDESRDIWLYSFDRGTLSRVTSSPGTEFDARWSPDGRDLFYVVDVPPFVPYRITLGGRSEGRPVWEEPFEHDATGLALTPDGRSAVYVLTELETAQNIYLRPLDGSEPPRALRATKAAEAFPTISPDGEWIAYGSDETGRNEIYAERIDGSGRRVQVTSDGGAEPLWSAGEIFYRRESDLMSAAVRAGRELVVEPPRKLFSYSIIPWYANDSRTFDVTADASRFLVISVPEVNRPRQIELVTNWLDGLRKRVPTR